MAGMMYLGNQKVTPVIIQGGSTETTGCVFRFPDNVTIVNSKVKRSDLFDGFPYPLTVDFNNVETISGTANFVSFASDINGLTLKMKHLKTISVSQVFNGSFAFGTLDLENSEIDFSSIESITGGSVFAWAFGYTNFTGVVRFTNLSTLASQALEASFAYTAVSEIYFNSVTSSSFDGVHAFLDMLVGVDGCTVHFPSNLESVIGSWSDVLSGFGGINTTVLFDLEPTEN